MKLLTATGIVTQVLRTFFETKFQGKCFKTIKTELFRAFQIFQNAHLNIFHFTVAFDTGIYTPAVWKKFCIIIYLKSSSLLKVIGSIFPREFTPSRL